METYFADFHTSFYIPVMQKLAFHLLHVLILGTNHCGNIRDKAFKRLSAKEYVLNHRDYSENVVAIFAHQIQYEYYGGNISVSIEGIVLEHFRAPTTTDTAGTSQPRTCHALFHSFFSDYIKQDSATTIALIKRIIQLLKQQNILSNKLSTIF